VTIFKRYYGTKWRGSCHYQRGRLCPTDDFRLQTFSRFSLWEDIQLKDRFFERDVLYMEPTNFGVRTVELFLKDV